MAIGLSLTPRSYNVDPTGRDFVLDPDPLLNVAEKTFASQRENLRTMAGVMQQGVALGEMIGARQQLGRVKAALSELDVNDPLFAQKYAAVVADNPLAFTNERVAPVTKAAVTPVLASAAQAMENRAALQRAQVMAGYQRQAAVQRADLQRDYYDYQIQNPRPGTPRPPSVSDALLSTGRLPESTPTPTPSGTNTQPAPPAGGPYRGPSYPDPSVYAPPIPVEGGDAYGGGLFDFSPSDPNGPRPEQPPFGAEDSGAAPLNYDNAGLEIGEGDGNDPLLTGRVSLQPVIRQTEYGPVVMEGAGPTGTTIKAVPDAVTPTYDPGPGFTMVADPNKYSGNPGEYRAVPVPDAVTKAQQESIDAIVNSDAMVYRAASLAQIAESKLSGLEKSAYYMSDVEKEKMGPQIAQAAIEAGAAKAEAERAKNLARIKAMGQVRPDLVNRYIQQNAGYAVEDPADEALLTGGATTSVAPAARPAPPPALSVREQLAQAQPNPERQVWDQEKRFALNEAKDLALRLGLRENSIIDAFEKDDRDSLNLIRKTAAERGVVSPLFDETMSVLPTPSIRPGFNSPGSPMAIPARGWARSKKLGRTYGEILRVAAQDPNYKAFRGETRAKRGYSIEPFVETK